MDLAPARWLANMVSGWPPCEARMKQKANFSPASLIQSIVVWNSEKPPPRRKELFAASKCFFFLSFCPHDRQTFADDRSLQTKSELMGAVQPVWRALCKRE